MRLLFTDLCFRTLDSIWPARAAEAGGRGKVERCASIACWQMPLQVDTASGTFVGGVFSQAWRISDFSVAVIKTLWRRQFTERRVCLGLGSQRDKRGSMAVTHILNCQQEAESQLEMTSVFWTLRACLHWHTSSNKATPSKPHQIPPPTENQVFKGLRLWGGASLSKHHACV